MTYFLPSSKVCWPLLIGLVRCPLRWIVDAQSVYIIKGIIGTGTDTGEHVGHGSDFNFSVLNLQGQWPRLCKSSQQLKWWAVVKLKTRLSNGLQDLTCCFYITLISKCRCITKYTDLWNLHKCSQYHYQYIAVATGGAVCPMLQQNSQTYAYALHEVPPKRACNDCSCTLAVMRNGRVMMVCLVTTTLIYVRTHRSSL